MRQTLSYKWSDCGIFRKLRNMNKSEKLLYSLQICDQAMEECVRMHTELKEWRTRSWQKQYHIFKADGCADNKTMHRQAMLCCAEWNLCRRTPLPHNFHSTWQFALPACFPFHHLHNLVLKMCRQFSADEICHSGKSGAIIHDWVACIEHWSAFAKIKFI